MIRTFWLATISLVVLGTLAIGKAVMMRASSPVAEQPTGLTTPGSGLSQETLGKADRLEITYVRPETPTAPVLPPTGPVVPAVASPPPVEKSPPPVENKIISRHWRDPNAFSSAMKPKQAKRTGSSKKGKIVN